MTLTDHHIDLISTVITALNHPNGVEGMIEEHELQIGAKLIPLGSTTPVNFTRTDWKRGILSELKGEIRIVTIEAKHFRNGAFTRLVAEIITKGYDPVVIKPIGIIMPSIMHRWGWQKTIARHGKWEWVEYRPIPIK